MINRTPPRPLRPVWGDAGRGGSAGCPGCAGGPAAPRVEDQDRHPYLMFVNNFEIGKWYSLTCFAFMLAAGVLALLMRVQLAFPGMKFLDADRFNQFFTMHGSAMMFLFAVPLFEAMAILILPAFLGARDMPFPRLSSFGYWSFLIGGVFVLGSVLFDAAPSSGWFMYPPVATEDPGVGSDIWLLGLSFIEIASIAAAVELIVGVLKCRLPGMRVNTMPLHAGMCWWSAG